VPPEDEQVVLETYTLLFHNKLDTKGASCWSYYTEYIMMPGQQNIKDLTH
jgi:hypothetical protein